MGILFIVGSNWFKVEMPRFFGDTTDELTNWSATNNSDDILFYALKVGGYFLILSLISGIFLFLMRQTIIVMSRLIEYDLKNEIYKHYQKLNYSFYKKNNTGDLMNRISEDVSHVRMYLGPGVMYTINLAVLSILVIINMVSISVPLTIAVLIPLPIMSFLIYTVASKINSISKTVQEEQSNMSTIAQETFTGIRVIKAYSRLTEAKTKFNRSAENYKNKNMRLVLVNSFFMPTIFLLIGVSTIVCIYLGGLLYYDKSITPGNIMTFIFYVNMLTWPFASIGWVTSLTQRAAASQGRINEFLKTEPEIVNNSTAPFDFQGAIEFKNVSYTYKNSGIQAIKDLSFKLEKGETLGIVGRTGSGKSTILKLLMRQIDPDQGEIIIDGVNIKDINMESYRDQTGIVPQEVFLFSDTIKNNLEFGSVEGDVSEERLIEVTKLAHVYHNIIELKDKFNTLLGERGVNLSGGQKQRLSIARALIRNPKLLILDDCLSAVDTETEEIILDNLKKTGSTTSIVVSHRISSIRNATHIINVEDGSVKESGTHQKLISLNGIYAEMYKKQLTEENA